MPTEDNPPDWFRTYLAAQKIQQDQQVVLDKIDGLGDKLQTINDNLNKIIILLIAVAGGDVGLKLVHSTPADIFATFFGGYLSIFCFGIVMVRWNSLSKIFRVKLLVFGTAGALELVFISIGTPDIGVLVETLLLIVGVTLVMITAWRIEMTNMRKKK